jgi:ankyrin repeat protein
MNLVHAEFQTLFTGMMSHEKGAEKALLDMIRKDHSLASATFAILEHKQESHPLFHFAQAASLESVMIVYSLYPKAIFSRTKSGYSPHHFAAGNRNDDVLRFLVLQHPKALAGKPSILQMLSERIHSVGLIKFCVSQYPQGLYDVCDENGNTLLHKACQVNSFPYLGPRPALIEYLVKEYPQAVEIKNKEGNLPLHLLLEQSPLLSHNIIHTKSAMLLLRKYPKSRKIPNHAGLLPIDLAMDASGGSTELILALADQAEVFLSSQSPPVIAAHLLQTNAAPHLMQCKVWDTVCSALAKAVASILYRNMPKYTQLTICFTRLEKTGLCLILQALERNTQIEQCSLCSNVGFYNQKVGTDSPEYPPSSLYCVAHGGALASDFQLSMALHKLFLNNSTLTALDLSDNILPRDPQFLFPLMSNRSLKWLSLARTNMGPSILQAMIPVLRHNKTLTDLNLSCPSIPQESLLELLQVLQDTRTLRRVVFYAASTRCILPAALTALQANPYLFHIHFDTPTSTTITRTTTATMESAERQQQQQDQRHRHQEQPIAALEELDYWSRLNRAGRYYSREPHATKHDFVMEVLAKAHASLTYGLLRDSVSLWAASSVGSSRGCSDDVCNDNEDDNDDRTMVEESSSDNATNASTDEEQVMLVD